MDELVERVEVLDSGIHIRPDNRGITGIPSLFWVEGPGATPEDESVEAFGLTVTVSFDLAGVEWDFGDGTPPVSAGLGEAWPERSSVQHTYRYANKEGEAYQVTATLIFQPSYTVNGAPGEELDPIEVEVTRGYVVRQIQAIRRS